MLYASITSSIFTHLDNVTRLQPTIHLFCIHFRYARIFDLIYSKGLTKEQKELIYQEKQIDHAIKQQLAQDHAYVQLPRH